MTATCKRMKLQQSLTPYKKINSKWIKDLNIRLDTIKLLEEKKGCTLTYINCSKIFFNPPPRIMKIKTKRNKKHLIKLKSFCTAQEIMNKNPNRMRENICQQIDQQEISLQNINSSCHLLFFKKPNQKMGR